MSDIRVTYSGLISFTIGLVGIVTGLIFTIIITRTVSVAEYGTWGLISGMFLYIVTFEQIISYWATRETARKIDSGKTALFSSGIFSVVGISVYMIIAYFAANQGDVKENILFFGAVLIPLIFLNRTLSAINLGWRPHAVSYGIFVFGVIQIPLAIIFVYFLDLGVNGIIITHFIAYLSNIIVQSIFARKKLRSKFQKNYLRKWIRFSWLPLYPGIATFIYFLDVVIFLVITGSVEGIALWTAALVITTIISQSGLISRAIYASVLSGGRKENFQENLIHLLYFAIPLTAITIIFAKPALFVLNPLFIVAYPVVILLSLTTFSATLSGSFRQFLEGIEKVDVNENSTFRDYIKSKLFFIPTNLLIQYCLYAGLLIIGFIILESNEEYDLDLIIPRS